MRKKSVDSSVSFSKLEFVWMWILHNTVDMHKMSSLQILYMHCYPYLYTSFIAYRLLFTFDIASSF